MPEDQIPNLELKIFANGSEVTGPLQVVSVTIDKRVNFIPTARIVVIDGDNASGDFTWSESAGFKIGSEIEVKSGTDAAPVSVYKGLIVGQRLQHGSSGTSLTLECKDKAIKSTISRKFKTFADSKDSDAITTVMGTYGLTTTIGATTVTHPLLVQYNVSDWDFTVTRAEANGQIVLAEGGTLTTKAPDESAGEGATITFGDNVIQFDLDIDSRRQYSKVVANAWDNSSQALVTATASEPTNGGQTTTATSLSSALSPGDHTLMSHGQEESSELTKWADGLLLKSRLSRVTGTVKIFSNTGVLPGAVVKLDGFGDIFNGKALVSGVLHEMAEGLWTTTITLGLSERWWAVEAEVTNYPASGQIPAAQGLSLATVTKIDSDPKSQTRVQIKDVLVDNANPFWARYASFYASNAVGNFFFPEIGDEVVYGYLNEDPRFPVILGSLYSAKNVAPFTPDNKNTNKGIVTKSKMKLTFDDDKKIITLTTPGNNKMVWDDEAKSITISDQNSNKVEMTSSGVTITSAKSLTLKATNDISIQSSAGKIALSASAGDVTASGLNVNLTAQIGAKVTGSATAEISASGQTTVKGAIVMIN